VANGVKLPTVQRVIIAGASVPGPLVEQLRSIIGGDVHTPYGASEALPVALIAGREIVEETAAGTASGAGTCVGRPAPGITIRVIRVGDEPIPAWSDDLVVPDGEVGELCVAGPVVTHQYANRPEATAAAKILEGDRVWHRMGDLGYRDTDGRIWFCGRKAERVRTASGPLYTDRIEGIANAKGVRTALVGVGTPGAQRAVLVVEGKEDAALAAELQKLVPVEAVLFHPSFPVDVRHNAKIHRLTLSEWAAGKLGAAA
jgi:acyl-CoA synthetase (AMP-forming)/AMP-acid ligase II